MVNKMREMKDSGVEWIGDIPIQWDVRPVKELFNRKKAKAFDENPVVLSLSRDSVKVRDITNNEGQLAESYFEYNPVEPGDLLLNPMDLYSGANCNVSEISGVISPAYVNLKSKNGVSSRYYDYYFKTQYWSMALFAHGLGVSFDNRWTLNNQTLMNYKAPVPDYFEQTQISEYLKIRITLIDNIIDKTKQSIEEYKKLKQSIITEAVTKGLNPDVKLKDSGIEWIGMIPEHWAVSKLKNVLVSPLKYGANESGVDYQENLPRYIRITDIDISDNSLKMENMLSLTEKQAETYILKHNDILFARSGGTVGKSFIFDERYGLSAFAGYLIKAEVSDMVNPKLIYYYTLSGAYEEWKNRIFIQATIQNIGASKYSNMEIVFPSNKDEQDKLVKFIDSIIDKFAKIFNEKNSLIAELESYKKSLIYEVVTGKKEMA